MFLPFIVSQPNSFILPPPPEQVRNWLSARIIAPNEFDQPEDPPRELTLEEMLEATCIRTLDRAEVRFSWTLLYYSGSKTIDFN